MTLIISVIPIPTFSKLQSKKDSKGGGALKPTEENRESNIFIHSIFPTEDHNAMIFLLSYFVGPNCEDICTRCLPKLCHSPTHPLTPSLTHPLARSLTYSLTHSQWTIDLNPASPSPLLTAHLHAYTHMFNAQSPISHERLHATWQVDINLCALLIFPPTTRGRPCRLAGF